jgi:hypothetical protein
VAIGDVNADGKPDLAVANNNSDTVSILIGDGAGSFGPKTDFTTGGNPFCVAIGDVDRDGKPDLAVANSNSNTVSILIGDGAGSFSPKIDFATGSDPRSVVVGNFNGDGMPDLAVADAGANAVSVLLGTGSGGFGTRTDFATGVSPVSVAVGDFDRDGMPDLATANAGVNSASVLRGTGTASTGSFLERTELPAGTSAFAFSVAADDFNGDGTLDVAVADAGTDSVSIFMGDGAGGFGAKTDYATGMSPYSVAIGDVDGDGKPDLAVANGGANTVSLLLGTGTGSFGTKADFSVAIGDFNRDGKPDLAVANYWSDNVSVLLGNGAGSFGVSNDFTTGGHPHALAIGDVDGDGKLDLATANSNVDSVSILRGDGTGSFAAGTDLTTGRFPVAVATGDLNRDGYLDLAVGNLADSTISIMLGTGGGGFGAKTDFATGTSPYSVAIGDLTHDGVPDLAAADYNADTVSVLLGGGSFGAKHDFATGNGPISATIADFNRDGRADLAIADDDAGMVSILLQESAFALTSALYCPGTCYPGGGASDLLALTGYANGLPASTSFAVGGRWDTACAPTYALDGSDVYQSLSATTSDSGGNLSGAEGITGLSSPLGAAVVGKYVSKHLALPDTRTIDSACALVELDTDGDGIADAIDPAPAVIGDAFSDGATSGTIVNRNSCYVSVVDAPNPADGAVIGNVCPPSGGGPATLSICGVGTLTIPDGGAITGSCDSFRSGVISGATDFMFGPPGHESDYVLHTGAGTSSVVADLGDNASFSVVVAATNLSSVSMTFGAGVVTLPQGTAITVTVLPSGQFQLTNATAPGQSGAGSVLVNGQPVVRGQVVALVGPAVGGISEAPDASTLPAAAPQRGGRSDWWGLSAALGAAALMGVAGWRLRRWPRAG